MEKTTITIDHVNQIEDLIKEKNKLYLIDCCILYDGKFYLNKSFNFNVNKKYPVKKKIALYNIESLLPLTISVIKESKERVQIFNI